MTKLIV